MITYLDLPFEIQDHFKKFPIGIAVEAASLTQRIYTDMDLTQQNTQTEVIPLGTDMESPYWTKNNRDEYFAIKILVELGTTPMAICVISGHTKGFVMVEDTKDGKAALTQIKLSYT